ncbi:unnamed protein product [Cylindrotheca closterium]|uniref:Mitochondrial carrier protein n=1 Tax=Cylindrotheca closterium TaxID=2856 RepID=A0AAD2CF29_9STRA|nr:unnamed protein product [Cylindrotheca closterium]
MEYTQSKSNFRNILFTFLVISLILQECAIDAHPFIAKVQQSPIGVGTSAAFRKYGSRRSFRSSSIRTSDGETPRAQSADLASRNEVKPFDLKTAHRIDTRSDQGDSEPSELEALLSSNNVIPAASKKGMATRPLLFWENMVCGAISRSIAQTTMHPANTMKTIMQSSRGADKVTFTQLFKPSMFKTLSRGAGATLALSIPHGAVNFAVLELVRAQMGKFVESVPALKSRAEKIGPGLDFVSSAVSTICCSVVSTPQMMITDNIMAGNYPALGSACVGLYQKRGIMGFYSGWWPGLAGKIPSYALTWTFFQQIKNFRDAISDRKATNYENSMMGCLASAATVCIMMPMDTIKTRLVTQSNAAVMSAVPYKGIIDCAVRIANEEGIKTFYRGLSPRLLGVVPMIGIQFGVYEAMKNLMLQKNAEPGVPLTATTM